MADDYAPIRRRTNSEPLTYDQPFEWEGRRLYSEYRHRFEIEKDWADLFDDERQEWRDDARKKAESSGD